MRMRPSSLRSAPACSGFVRHDLALLRSRRKPTHPSGSVNSAPGLDGCSAARRCAGGLRSHARSCRRLPPSAGTSSAFSKPGADQRDPDHGLMVIVGDDVVVLSALHHERVVAAVTEVADSNVPVDGLLQPHDHRDRKMVGEALVGECVRHQAQTARSVRMWCGGRARTSLRRCSSSTSRMARCSRLLDVVVVRGHASRHRRDALRRPHRG